MPMSCAKGREREHRRSRQLMPQALEPVSRGLLAEDLVEHDGQGVPVIPTRGDRREARVLGQVTAVEFRNEVAPELLGHAHDEDPAVPRRE